MRTRTWIPLILALGVTALGACKNPERCTGNPHNDCRLDGAATCSSNDQCGASTPVCDTGSMTCVQCTPAEAGACTGVTPACGADNTCVACSKHTDCASSACLPDGSCGSDSNVAYVAPTGSDNPQCSKAMPCRTVAMALQTGREYVKFSGTTDEAVLIQQGRKVKFIADQDAKLTRSTIGAILTVKDDGTSLAVHDLSISEAPNNIGVVIPAGSGMPSVSLIRAKITNNPGGGISASGGSLTVAQSTISGNTGGGISVMNGTFVIVGNVFFGNGTLTTATVGGISISTTQNVINRLEFNTFYGNAAVDGFAPAVQCMVGGTFTARNNIMSGNLGPTNMDQVGGNCMHTYSILRPGTVPPGAGNSNMDPLFVNTTTGDLHVRPSSPVRGAADPSSDLTGLAGRDIDGDLRTSPADIGADEVP